MQSKGPQSRALATKNSPNTKLKKNAGESPRKETNSLKIESNLAMIEIIIEQPQEEIFDFGDDDSDYKRLKQMFSDSDASSVSSSSSAKSDVNLRISKVEDFNIEF